MVLVVLPYPGQVLAHRNAMAPQFLLGPDPGLHQELGRVDRAQRQHHLARGAEHARLAIEQHFHPGHPVVLEREPRHQRASQHGEVGLRHARIGVRAEHR